MPTIPFFTAVQQDSILGLVDDYFFLGGKKAEVITPVTSSVKKVKLVNASPMIPTALKVISYFTIVIPLIALLAKVILRSQHHFEEIALSESNEKNKTTLANQREHLGRKLGRPSQSAQDLVLKNPALKSRISWLEDQPLKVQSENLNLDLTEQGYLPPTKIGSLEIEEIITMGDVIDITVKAINKKITDRTPSPSNPSTARSIDLNISSDFKKYALLGASGAHGNKNQLWLYRILNALMQKEHIFSFEAHADKYVIQA